MLTHIAIVILTRLGLVHSSNIISDTSHSSITPVTLVTCHFADGLQHM